MMRKLIGMSLIAGLLGTAVTGTAQAAAPAVYYSSFFRCGSPANWVNAGGTAMIQAGFTSSPVHQNANLESGANADTDVAVESTVSVNGSALITVITSSMNASSASFWVNAISSRLQSFGCQ